MSPGSSSKSTELYDKCERDALGESFFWLPLPLSGKDGRENDRDVIDETCALLAGKNVPIDYFLG